MQRYEHPKIRYKAAYQVIGLKDHVDFREIAPKFDAFIQSKYLELNLDDLIDWRVILYAVYCHTDTIKILKRPTRYPSDLEAVVSFPIPIPSADDAPYGFGEKGWDGTAKNLKLFHILETDFLKYDNLTDYIYESVIRAIDEIFKQGFTVNGKKIKYQH